MNELLKEFDEYFKNVFGTRQVQLLAAARDTDSAWFENGPHQMATILSTAAYPEGGVLVISKQTYPHLAEAARGVIDACPSKEGMALIIKILAHAHSRRDLYPHLIIVRLQEVAA